jgi:hypothetical protein
MTTFKGKPFDRPSLESLMKVRNNNLSDGASHTDRYSDDYSTHPLSISMAVSLVSTTLARPAAPSPTTLSTYGGNTLC